MYSRTIEIDGVKNTDIGLRLVDLSLPSGPEDRDIYVVRVGLDGTTHYPQSKGQYNFTATFRASVGSMDDWIVEWDKISQWLHGRSEQVKIKMMGDNTRYRLGKALPTTFTPARRVMVFSVDFKCEPFKREEEQYIQLGSIVYPSAETGQQVNLNGPIPTAWTDFWLGLYFKSPMSDVEITVPGTGSINVKDTFNGGDNLLLNTQTMNVRKNTEDIILKTEGVYPSLGEGSENKVEIKGKGEMEFDYELKYTARYKS